VTIGHCASDAGWGKVPSGRHASQSSPLGAYGGWTGRQHRSAHERRLVFELPFRPLKPAGGIRKNDQYFGLRDWTHRLKT
jgi:hypothetical protein